MAKYDATRGIFIPDYLFDKLIGEKNGENLVALWLRYARQARMQNSEETKSFDGFISSQLGWGADKLKTSKKALKELGLIETERTSDGDWVTKVYGEFEDCKPNSGKIHHMVENPLVENPPVIDNTMNSIIKKDKREKEKKEKTEEEKANKNELNDAIARYYDAVNDSGLIAKKEVNEFVGLTAIRTLINSSSFKKAAEGIGKGELVYQVSLHGLKDEFWSDKVISLSGMCKHFATLYAQARKAGKLKTTIKIDASKFEEGFKF